MRKSILCVGVAVFFCLPPNMYAVNGIAISTFCRNFGGIDFSQVPEQRLAVAGRQGNMIAGGIIVRSFIRDNQVTKTDTLYDRTFARYPAFSFDGSRIAFLRYEARIVDNQLVGEDKPIHLSVMDADGGNVRDILSFGADLAKNHCSIDWPAGDWIYYQKLGTFEIWKVKLSDPSTNSHVYTYSASFRKWEMSVDASRAIIQYNEGAANANLPHIFPPAFDVVPDDWPHKSCAVGCGKCTVGCNAVLSPSGRFMGHFANTGHTYIRINEWALPRDCLSSHDVICDSMSSWAGADVGASMDWPRWSANSDKWVSCFIGSKIAMNNEGGNQVLVNWIDNQAIKVTHNRIGDHSAQIVHYNTAGDFFIEGPENAYEDIEGKWIAALSGKPLSAMPGIRSHAAPIRLVVNNTTISLNHDIQFPCTITFYNGQGRSVHWTLTGENAQMRIPRGLWIAKIHTAHGVRVSRLVLVR